MIRPVPTSIAAVAAAALLLGAAQAGSAATAMPTLYVNYTMSCTFTITDDAGNTVTALNPGTYQVLITTPVDFGSVELDGVNDMMACGGSVQFQLTGPGVDLTDTLADGDDDSSLDLVTLQKSSTYVAVDNNQPTVAHWTFTTNASGTPTAPTVTYGNEPTTAEPSNAAAASNASISSSGSDRLRGQLAASLSAAGKASLTRKGKAVTTLTSGRYTIVVEDRSRKSGFVLRAIGKAATTLSSSGFVGRKHVTVDLKPGQWFFYASPRGAKSFFIAVAPA